MEHKVKSPGKFSSFRIVLLYAIFSAVYIYSSDYFLESFVTNVDLLTKLQTEKGLVFILATTLLLYILVKRNNNNISAHYQQIIDVQQHLDSQLQQSQEEYMSLFNHSPLPMWLFDIKTLQFILVNEAACSVYGYTAEEYTAMNLWDIRPSQDIPLMEDLVATTFKSEGYCIPSIVRHQKKNGEIIQVKVKTTNVIFEGRKVRLASTVDVTTEMETQNKLQLTNSRLQLASEIANLGYWTNDLVTSQVLWSEETYKIFEVDAKSFIPSLNSIKGHFHQDDWVDFDPEFFKDNTINESERRIITSSGKFKWVLVRQYLINDENGNPVKLEGIVLDINKIKVQEQEALERMHQIESQNKVLKDISWTQSHIVRAPLANLIGFINLLKGNKNAPVDDSLIDYISDSAQKLDSIIHDIVNKTSENNNLD